MSKKEKIFLYIVILGIVAGMLSMFYCITSYLRNLTDYARTTIVNQQNVVCNPVITEDTFYFVCNEKTLKLY